MSVESAMPSNHLILLRLLLLLPSTFPTIRVFSSELALHRVLLIAPHFPWGTTPPLPSTHVNPQPGTWPIPTPMSPPQFGDGHMSQSPSRISNALITCLIIHWSRDCTCTEHVADHALFSWLIMHWSSGYHPLITWLIIHWSCDWSCRVFTTYSFIYHHLTNILTTFLLYMFSPRPSTKENIICVTDFLVATGSHSNAHPRGICSARVAHIFCLDILGALDHSSSQTKLLKCSISALWDGTA